MGTERTLFGFPRGDLHFAKGDAGYTDGGLSGGTIDDRTGGENVSAGGLKALDDFAGRASGGDDVLNDDAALAGSNREAPAERHFSFAVAFGEDETDAEGAGDFVSDDDAAEGRRNDCLGRPISGQRKGLGEFAAERFGVLRMRQDEGALKVFGRVKAGRKSKVAF